MTARMRRRRAGVALAIAIAAGGACGTRPAATGGGVVEARTSALIVDATRGNGTPGFHWIPPMTTAAAAFTTLDTTGGSNGLTVRIDRLYADAATDPAAKATFTGTAIRMVTGTSDASFPGVTGPFYGVNWAAGSTVAAGQTYRVSVQAQSNPTRVLGVADVQVVASATAAGQVDRTRFTPLVAGASANLAIVFRLEAKDTDADGVNDWRDDCPVTKNPNQLDSNKDGRGDACQCLNVPNGTACSTGCRSGETCQSGACTAGTAVANGTACATGNPCKTGETCTTGVCGGGTNRAGGTVCTTGNPCRTGETCMSGACAGGGARGNGTACATGNPCKTGETCTSGVCGGGSNRAAGTACTTANPCKTGETCTTGVCGGGSNRANGMACGDANLCTQADTCQAGVCTGGGAVTCATDACHNTGTCDARTGLCPARKADGTTCSDANACTLTDTCQAGACTAGSPKTCTPVDSCHLAGMCDPASGVCSSPPRMGGTCGRNPFEYDGAGRLVRDGDAALTYNAYDQLLQMAPAAGAPASPTTLEGRAVVPMRHTYGYDGLRTSTLTNAGQATQTADYWFREDYAERSDGRRDHYLRVGDRVVARLSFRPPGMAAVVAGEPAAGERGARDDGAPPSGGGRGPTAPAILAVALAALMSLALLVLASSLRPARARVRVSGRRRLAAALAALTLAGALPPSLSCNNDLGFRSSAATAWTRSQELYFHQGVAAGPALITDATAAVFEERRYEPFGAPVDAFRTATGTGATDFKRDPQNALNKETDATTEWSYHGARWMAPQTARWLSPDPAVKGPDPKRLRAPWDFNPYQYGRQAPTLYWDPNGADVYMVIYTNRASDNAFGRAAATRVREIEASPTFNPLKDHVYMAPVADLGKLDETVELWKSSAMFNDYGKTVSLDVFGHNGLGDGPIGDLATSNSFALSDAEQRQMSIKGWRAINFNWDEKRSIAAFHGCHTMAFAKKFSQLQPVRAIAGFSTSSFPSTNPLTRSSRVFAGSNDLYFVGSSGDQRLSQRAGMGETSASPMTVIDKNGTTTEVWGNPNPPPANAP